MALRDASCYTLSVEPSRQDPTIMELKESNGEVRYARVREKVEGEAYATALYDAFSGAKLASAGYVSEKLKTRRLELHGPDVSVGMEFTGRLQFEWTFIFEGNKYKWKRDIVGKDMMCSLDRKPEPSVDVCLAREADKRDFTRISILHYNIERFLGSDIKDLRGLENLLVMSVLCLLDAAEERQAERAASTGLLRANSSGAPKVPPKSGSPTAAGPERVITPEDFEPEESNEIIVGVNTDLQMHVDRALALLCDDSILYVVIRTKRPEAAQRAMQVCLGVTRARHRNGDPELHQYVHEEQPPPPPGPRVINLDDPKPEPWRPPLLSIYLSREELPDLKPGRREALASASSHSHPSHSHSMSKPKYTPVPLSPAPRKTNALPDVRLSPPPSKQQHDHGSAKPPKSSPPVPPAPSGYGQRPAGPSGNGQNGKLKKPAQAEGEKHSSFSRLFSKSRA